MLLLLTLRPDSASQGSRPGGRVTRDGGDSVGRVCPVIQRYILARGESDDGRLWGGGVLSRSA